uniref:Uncharacterized protein n=1 Tax=Kalanchoe fedtschenkoi TaxID=63787 RepID=A0A7N0UNJ6_KALFE
MRYEQRLITAAKIVLDRDNDAAGDQPLNCAEIGVTATLKPHQVEGVKWLIRRYKTGVNVILGTISPSRWVACHFSYRRG